MDPNRRKLKEKYGRVMSRVYNRSQSSLDAHSFVTRHENSSTARIGAKHSVSNLISPAYSDLPTVLNDFVPDNTKDNNSKRTSVVKPRRTVRSLDPNKSPEKVPPVFRKPRVSHIKAPVSAPTVRGREDIRSLNIHTTPGYSSRSHKELNILKTEINTFRENEKLLRMRAKLYKSCGIVLDDVGQVCSDKAVQAEPTADAGEGAEPIAKRSEQRSGRSDDGAALSDQQMRFAVPRYPVDRYLVESSNKFEMVSIINDDIWNVEPALRPEDEIMLRKLHDMLQSTADDLKVLSGELTRHHEPGVQVTTKPMPADDEFNEKVHIEEVVNAKFHGYTIVDESKPLRKEIGNSVKKKQQHIEQNVKNTLSKSEPEANAAPILKTSTVKRNLGISRTRTMQIIGDINEVKELQKDGEKMSDSSRFVAYSEVCYKYEQKPNVNSPNKLLKIQEMPSINIRSDLKEQKVFHLDIFPEKRDGKVNLEKAHNVSVIQVQHKIPKPLSNNNLVKRPVRKFTRISTNESSESTNNVSSEVRTKMLTQDKTSRGSVTINTKPSVSSKINLTRKEKQSGLPKRSKSNVDLWKKKLDYIYGQPSSSRKTKNNSRSQTHIKTVSPKKTSIPLSEPQKTKINDSCYIPYSQLTLGGVRVSDLEKELSDGQIKNDAPLTDILDKIISSKENSFHNDSPRKNIFTTSDENLLQEIINIESKISKPLSKTSKSKIVSDENTISDLSLETSKNQSYEDDFEEEVKSQGSEQRSLSNIKKSKSKVWNDNHKNNDKLKKETEDCINLDSEQSEIDHNDTTYIKGSNLSLRDNVDIHEYVHSIDTQDNATQINTTKSLQATQTSPTNCKNTIQPIRNDLWPNSEGEVAKMFEIEKDLIKKLIFKEYGDLIEKTINKPSSSCNEIQQSDKSKNVISTQKNTQTSPSHVKSVMTSPTTTKTRTTSPMELNITVDHQTSPIVRETDIKEPSILTEILKSDTENLDITINLSSPRFNLRLPQTSREVFSNLELNGNKTSAIQRKKIVSKDITCRTVRRYSSSSTSMDADASSSEISSIGEIQYKLKRMLRKSRNLTFSESSTASSVSKTSSDLLSTGILPLRSEGEMSLGQTALRQRSRKNSKSVEEKSLGQL